MKRALSSATVVASLTVSVATSPAEWSARDSVSAGEFALGGDDLLEGVDLVVSYDGPDQVALAVDLVLDGENLGTGPVELVLYALDAPLDGALPEDAVELDRKFVHRGEEGAPKAFELSFSVPAEIAPVSEYHLAVGLDGEGPVEGTLSASVYATTQYEPEDGTILVEIEAD